MVQTKTPTGEKPPVVWRLLSNRKSRNVTLAILAGVILLAGVWLWYDRRVVIDRSVIAETSIAVYSPRQAPDGYVIDSRQTSLRRGVLSYTFASQSDKADLTVTVQDKPLNFDMGQLTHGGTVNSTATDNGTLYDLSAGGSSQYLLDTGSSLIFITSADAVDRQVINSLVADLRKVN